MVDHWLTDCNSASIHKWYSLTNASISYNFMVSYFHFCYLYFRQETKFWLIHLAMTCVSRVLDSHRFTRCSLFWFLIFFKYHSVRFPSRLLAGNTFVLGPIHVPNYIGWGIDTRRQIVLICFCIFKSGVLFSYLAVNYSLVHS